MIKNSLRLAILVLSTVALVLSPISVAAETVGDDLDFFSSNDILFYSSTAQSVCIATGASGAATGLANVPDPWRSLIVQTAPKYDTVDARLVAATLWIENRGWPDFNKKWATSSASAKGPWQVIPNTWDSMGTDGDGDGIKDPNNPKDAVHAAFKHQLGSAGKPIIEGYTGDIEAGLQLEFHRDSKNLLSYLANYNGGGAPSNTKLADFPKGDQNSDYVIMGYYLLASNFTEVWDTISGNIKPINEEGTSSQNDTTCGSTSGVGMVNAEGYSFPAGITKDRVSNGYSWPCPSICHHDGSGAFDLADKTTVSDDGDDITVGAPVFAIHDGEISNVRVYQGITGCYSIQFKGSDGWYYWYGHIANVTVKPNQKVSAGQQIAEIGPRKCTGNGSYPHVHIDRGYPKGHTAGSVGSRDKDFVPLINKLYEQLPAAG